MQETMAKLGQTSLMFLEMRKQWAVSLAYDAVAGMTIS